MTTRLLACTALALSLAAPLAANPAEGVVALDVLPGWRTDTGTHMTGLKITLAPGWKTYWRVPGDGGIPPRFAWDGSENVSGAAFHWPVPEVFYINEMRSIGYTGTVVIPVELSLPDGDAPARMSGQVQLGVCEEICVPVLLPFDAVLPPEGRRDPAIVASLIDRPQTAGEAGVGNVTCSIEPIENGVQVTSRIPLQGTGGEEVVIEAGNQQVWVSDPYTWREGGALFARSDMIHVNGGGFALNRSDMRITVFAGGQSIDIQGCGAN